VNASLQTLLAVALSALLRIYAADQASRASIADLIDDGFLMLERKDLDGGQVYAITANGLRALGATIH
jgi:hypothetical protein